MSSSIKARRQAVDTVAEKNSKREWRLFAAILFFIALVYALLPIYLNGLQALSHPKEFGGFWSPDSGARFAMIRSWVEHGRLIHLFYPHSDIDPTGQIHPLAYFLFHQAHGFFAMYPPLFPYLSGLAYRAFGFYGLNLVPAFSGLGCLIATYVTAQRLNMRSQRLLVPAMALATPLIIYSAVFWDHSAIMMVVALTGYWFLRALQDDLPRSAVFAGVVVGSGLWLHELFLALFAAAWLAALPLFKTRRHVLIGFPAGFFAVALCWAMFNWWSYGTFGGAHLGANVFQNNSDHSYSLASILNMAEFGNRCMVQLVGTPLPSLGYWVSPVLWPRYLVFACLLTIYPLWSWENRTKAQTWIMLALNVAGAVLAIFLVSGIHITAAGLFEATPLLIPALAVPWSIPKTIKPAFSESIYFAWLSRTVWLFILFLLINPMYPGTDWGSRYLLSALPLLVLLAAHALEQQYQNMKGGGQILVLISTAGLIGASFACQCCGLSWVHRSLTYDQELGTQLRTISSPVLVTNRDFNSRLAFAPTNQARFLIRTNDDEELFIAFLRRTATKEFTYVGSEQGAVILDVAMAYSGLPFRGSLPRPLFKADQSMVGEELYQEQFTLRPESGAALRPPH